MRYNTRPPPPNCEPILTHRLRETFLALGLILLVLGGMWYRSVAAPLSIFDQPFYLGIAYDMQHQGLFTNGFAHDDRPDGERPPGMFIGPIEPALLLAAAWVDPAFDRAMNCVAASHAHDPTCPKDATVARTVNFLMLVAVALMLWSAAIAVSGRRRVGWIALGLFLVTGPGFIVSANYTMTELPSLFFFTAATSAAVAALHARRRAAWLAAAGVFLALAALTRPAFFYLFVAACVAGGVWALVRGDRRRSLALAAAFALGGIATLAPWMTRNAVEFGRPAITHGYDAEVLVQRIAFDRMTPRQYVLSYLCWLPDGNGLGRSLFGPHTCDVFGWDDRPDTFYSIGNNALMRDSLAAAGGKENFLPYLLRTEILRHPLKHALVTIPLALRGAWIDHYWGLVGFVLCVALTWRAVRRRHLGFLAMSLPAWFMLLFNAAVAVNQTRYNLMLALPFALSFGICLDRAWTALQARRQGPPVAA